MARKSTRNSFPSAVVPFIAILTLLIVVTALAQVTGADRPSGKANAVFAPADSALAQGQQSLTPWAHGAGRFPGGGSQTKRRGPRPMDANPPHFVPVVGYDPGGFLPVAVTVADVNLDGIPDLIVASGGQDPYRSSMGVLLGNGDGTFQPTVSYDAGPTGGEWASVAVADVNLDGKPDLVGSFGVLLGNGDGTFQPFVASGGWGGLVAVADINGDGIPDLVENAWGELDGLLGNGDGTFQPPIWLDGGFGEGLAIADVNRDGKPDLIATGYDNVGVLLGNGDGTFQPKVTYPLGGVFDFAGCSPVVADVNGDGTLDLVVAIRGSGKVGVLLGNGDGTFQPTTGFAAGGAKTIAVGDVNGDGVPDVLASNYVLYGTVGVLLGNGDGTFQGPIVYQSGGYYPDAVAIADVNRDGRPDLLVVNRTTPNNDNVGVLLNNTGAPPTTIELASSLNPARTRATVTYTATVKAQSSGAVTGFVWFNDGSSYFPKVRVADNQAASSTAYTKGGVHAVTATYSGDVYNLSSTSATLMEYIAGAVSKTFVTTSGSPSFVGQPVTFTATVTSTYGAIPNGELVTFYDGTTTLGSVALTSGTAAYTTAALSGKMHTIKAMYLGDANFKPSTGTVKQVVDKYPTRTELSSSPNPSQFGQAVTFTAQVASSGPAPTGKVRLVDGTTVIRTVTLSGGVATLTTSKLAVGTHPITAEYLGDAASAQSTSSVLDQVVQ